VSTTTSGADVFVFHRQLGGQVLPVKILRSIGDNGKLHFSVSMRQAPPNSHDYHPDPVSLAQSIGVEVSEIGFRSEEGKRVNKPQVLSTSTTHHLFVPLSSVAALNRVTVQRDKLLEQLALVNKTAYGIYLFTPVPSSGVATYQARFFSPGMSGEDPATGIAAGPLSAYLFLHGQLKLVDDVGRVVVQQGLKVGRECVINVTLSRSGDTGHEILEVDFEGSGVVVATGELAVPGADIAF
jgi:trans-2,3-dihydro-3-hydroxyanthranilate isomerase